MEIGALFTKYNSDKNDNDHQYGQYYQKYLPNPINHFLEIGVWQAGGIRAFKEFYKSDGHFHSLNHVFGGEIISVKQLDKLGIASHEGSQSDIAFLGTIKTAFDVIVEDGSHHSDEQIITFKHLFMHNVSPGGVYILEDLHCCLEKFWWRGVVDGYENTFLAVIKKVIAGGDFNSQFFSQAENDYYKSIISRIELCDDKIVFIWHH
jgi:hypothetical protein